LLKLYYSIHNSIRICKRGVVAAYHVVWECVVEQWLGVRCMLSNKRLAMGCVEGYLLYSQVHSGLMSTICCSVISIPC